MFMSLKLIAIGLGHKLGHSERLEQVIYKAEYITWTEQDLDDWISVYLAIASEL